MSPEKVKIGGIEYKIKRVDNCDEDNHNVDSKIIYSKQQIRIKKGIREAAWRKYIVAWNTTWCIWFLWGEQDEQSITRLSNVLYQFFIIISCL